jgi:hypothetical protein
MKKVMDEKFVSNSHTDPMGLRIYMSNLFDRNAEFKAKAKDAVVEYLGFIECFAKKAALQYFELMRREDLTAETKLQATKKLSGELLSYSP